MGAGAAGLQLQAHERPSPGMNPQRGTAGRRPGGRRRAGKPADGRPDGGSGPERGPAEPDGARANHVKPTPKPSIHWLKSDRLLKP